MARYYELCDRRLAELMAAAPADTTWLVVADHGFYTGRARPSVQPDDFGVGAAQWHRMIGVFLATGPRVRPGKIRDVHIDDLSRTLLWLLGAPSSSELRGKALISMMYPGWADDHPPTEIESYSRLPLTWMSRGARSSLDEARIQELRALGYVVDEEPPGGAPPTTGAIPPSTGAAVKATEPYNLGKIAYADRDLDTAERFFLQALEIEPGFAAAMISLAAVSRDRGDHQSSLRWILRALETRSPMLHPGLLIDMVREAEAAGVLERALSAFDLLRESWEAHSSFHTARGIGLLALGHQTEAEAEFRTALAKDPADPTATEEMLRLAARGRPIDTDGMLEAHLAAVQNDIKRLNQLAVVCLRQHRPDFAERALRPIVESDPSNVGVLSNMAAALQMQGRGQEAIRMLADAVRARPGDADLHFNHGAVLASLGRHDEALSEFKASQRLGKRGPSVVIAKAKVLVRLNRIGEARAELEAGARTYPEHREILQLLAELRLGG
jgi:tetratricopeptide (TPR) repeat protein